METPIAPDTCWQCFAARSAAFPEGAFATSAAPPRGGRRGAGSVDRYLCLGKAVLHGLKRSDRAAELLSVRHLFHAHREHRFGHADQLVRQRSPGSREERPVIELMDRFAGKR